VVSSGKKKSTFIRFSLRFVFHSGAQG